LDVEGDLTLADALVIAGLAKSRGEARRLASQGGLSVDDRKVVDVDVPLRSVLGEAEAILLRAGKKRFKRVVVLDRT
jgi:tyrosyl-tRNA synthetase